MKKKIIAILIVAILIIPFNVKAGNMDSYVDWYLDKTVFAHQYKNGEDHITNLAWMTVDSETAYCIEPGILADKESYYSSTNNIYDTNLGGIDTKRLSLIGYYGYGYKDHSSRSYYMATQELIWRFMGVENVWWTDQREGGNTFNIENEKNEIMRLVNNHEVAPSFNIKDNYIVGDRISLNDNNNLLSEYELSNGDINIDQNTISLDIKEGNNTFTLRRKRNGRQPAYYYKSGYQTIGVFKGVYDFEKTYTINGTYGKVTVEKYDNDTKTKESVSKYASLEGASYNLYDSNYNVIKTLSTNENGSLIFDGLSKGTYYVQEVEASKGYTVSSKMHEIVLDTDNINVVINSYEDIIKNKILLIKVLDDINNGLCIPEEGIWFSVYDVDNNFITKGVTDDKGNLTFELNYGKYIIKQDNAPNNIDKVDDITINVSQDGITQNFALVNHPINEKTYKVFSTKKRNISLPKTGKHSILYILILLISSIVYYEKKTA